MKCGEPKPGNGWRECDIDNPTHPGDHSYLGQTWPRLVPAEPDWDVNEVLEDTAPRGAWGLAERDYYIAFEVTNVYLVKVTGESEDQALKQHDDYCDFPDFSHESAIDGSVEVRRPEQHERVSLTGAPIGPVIACPGCGALAMSRSWYHRPLRKCHGPIEWTTWVGGTGKLWASRKREAHAGRAVTA